jgi:hypothetical protein
MDERSAKLLLKAVRMLPQREQDQVLTALLRDAFADPVRFAGPLPDPGQRDVVMLSGASPMLFPQPGMTGPAAMLPVRLPPELHERLRDWSAGQGFSMAGVVRGLVERFLDERSGKAPRKRPAARSSSKRAGSKRASSKPAASARG